MSEERYDEFVEQLHDAHPEMFTDPYGGVAVSEGWWPIIITLCETIQNHINSRQQQHDAAAKYNKIALALKHGDVEPFTMEHADKGLTADYVRRRCEEMIKDPLRTVPDPVPQVIVEQIKEKFGGLRFYYSGGDDFISGAVWFAESMAARTCEQCGAPGTHKTSGWIRTLCKIHYDEDLANRDAA